MQNDDAYQIILGKQLLDLNPVTAGDATLTPGKRTVCTDNHGGNMLIHYVYKGCGVFNCRGEEYLVHAGQAFLLQPSDYASSYYVADLNDPWSYAWISFNGALSSAFADLPPVFDVPEGQLSHLTDLRKPNPMLEYQLASDLMLLYATLLEPKKRKQDYVQLAIDFIQANYMNEISVEEVAQYVGLNRYYLSRLFKRKSGKSIQQYLLEVRLHEARRLLMQDYFVKEVAAMSGFRDVSNFSKIFKREQDGLSPSTWRLRQIELTKEKVKT